MKQEQMKILIARSNDFLDLFTYDVNGRDGRGGNGGLITKETIQAADKLRMALETVKEYGDG